MNLLMLRIAFASVLVMMSYTVASAQESQALLGSWSYESMTNLKHGKPFGTVHFKSGQWTVTFMADGHWAWNFDSKPQSGTYKVHKHELVLKRDGAASEDRYEFRLENDGKVLILTNKDTIYQVGRQL